MAAHQVRRRLGVARGTTRRRTRRRRGRAAAARRRATAAAAAPSPSVRRQRRTRPTAATTRQTPTTITAAAATRAAGTRSAGIAQGLTMSSYGASSGSTAAVPRPGRRRPPPRSTRERPLDPGRRRTGRREPEDEREEDEPPDEARVGQGRGERTGRRVRVPRQRELGVDVGDPAPGQRGAQPEEGPAGRLLEHLGGEQDTDQPAGDRRDHERHVGRRQERPGLRRPGQQQGGRDDLEDRGHRPRQCPRQRAPGGPHPVIVTAMTRGALRVSTDSQTGACSVVRRRRRADAGGHVPDH